VAKHNDLDTPVLAAALVRCK